jgi:hypothetical protein
MLKYLFQGSYTVEGLRGLLRDGGTKRREVVEQLVTQQGGRLEAFYYAYGGDDFSIIVDMPDEDGLQDDQCAGGGTDSAASLSQLAGCSSLPGTRQWLP